jgi:hypothetical protein
MNKQIFPIKVRTTAPNPFGNSADMDIVAIGEDGMDYAVKKGGTAASEALCYQIYSACGIAVPYFSTLIMLDGSYAFGSRIERGLSKIQVCTPTEQLAWMKACGSNMSAIFALDFFVANDDRHSGNFLFLNGLNDRKSCMALDFSRALLYAPWPLPKTWLAVNNTTLFMQALRYTRNFDSFAAVQALISAAAIEPNTWSDWIDTLPIGWIKTEFKTTLAEWWGSADFQKRLQECMGAVK